MLGLQITNPIRWSNEWSARLGSRLEIRDSSNDLLIFNPKHNLKEIREVLRDIPDSTYRLLEVEPAATEDCEFWTDNGKCYRHHD